MAESTEHSIQPPVPSLSPLVGRTENMSICDGLRVDHDRPAASAVAAATTPATTTMSAVLNLNTDIVAGRTSPSTCGINLPHQSFSFPFVPRLMRTKSNNGPGEQNMARVSLSLSPFISRFVLSCRSLKILLLARQDKNVWVIMQLMQEQYDARGSRVNAINNIKWRVCVCV